MSEVTKITCDGCGAHLTWTGNSVDYSLRLSNVRTRSRGGFVTDMMIYPPIEHQHDFCGLVCMDKWRDAVKVKDAARKAFMDSKRTDHGNGVFTYPSNIEYPPELQ